MENLVQTNHDLRIIAALGLNREIGSKGELPWKIPEDLKHFYDLTSQLPIDTNIDPYKPYKPILLMGRKTYESIIRRLGKPLPNRLNLVLSGTQNFKDENVVTVNCLESAIDYIDSRTAWVIGGHELYEETLNEGLISVMELTLVKREFPEADTFFPEFNERDWHKQTLKTQSDYSFVRYIKLNK